MKENDIIKELFKERFESFEVPVDPKVWSGIESSLGNVAPSTGVSSLSTKAVIGLVVGATVVASIGAVSLFNTADPMENITEVVSSVNNKELVTKELFPKQEESVNEISTAPMIKETVSVPAVVKKSEISNLSQSSGKKEEKATKVEIEENEITQGKILERESAAVLQEDEQLRNPISTEVVSQAPATIDISEQSRAQAYPAGGVAPLNVSFSSIGEVEEIKWKFDDGTESSELNPDHEFENPGVYFVTMLAKLKDGTVVMDKAVVEVKEAAILKDELESESSSIGTIGNYFTPNGDGEHDEFIVNVQGVQSYSISIYAVNGQLVYTSNDPNKGWNGNDLSGNRVMDGTYYYMINAIGEDQKVYSPKGYLTVTGGF